MRTFQVEVTQDDIDKGRKAVCMACPIALAIKRTILGSSAIVCGLNIRVYLPDGNTMVADTPDDAAWFVRDFDESRPVKPFSFALTLE